ncbi:MAG: ThuA domain-containing protein [Actinobacteria bacterium]|nr:ThuA domain-containing protein [Actinomycetota bacterium]
MKERDTVLFVTQVAPYHDGPAGVHGVLGQAATAVGQLAELYGLHAQRVADVRELEPHAVANARAVALFTIGETPWSTAQRAELLDGLRSGRVAVVAIHSATDSCYGWPEYGAVVGARFDGHPWTQELDIEIVDRDHPATGHLEGSWRWKDEVYQFRDLRPDARVLLRAPEAQLDLDAPGAKRPEFGFPLSWCFTEGDGRVFSTSLGHFPGAWENVTFLRHLAGGVGWALEDGT